MKNILIGLFTLFFSVVINGQVGSCANRINSVVFTPITGTNDINLSINSQYCNAHNLNTFVYTNNAPNHVVTLCYIDALLLMPSTITSNVLLTNANLSGVQNFTINSNISNLGTSDPCASSTVFNSPITLTFITPLTESRTFLSLENDFNIKKISLSPNPNSGSFSIDLPEEIDQVQLSISDLSGKEVYYTDAYISGKMLQLKELSKGLYFVKIDYNQTTETLKFIVN